MIRFFLFLLFVAALIGGALLLVTGSVKQSSASKFME